MSVKIKLVLEVNGIVKAFALIDTIGSSTITIKGLFAFIALLAVPVLTGKASNPSPLYSYSLIPSGNTLPSNLKQMAAALQFMREHQIREYDQLTTEAEAASARFHALTEQLRQTEADLAHTSELMGAVVQYAKTRPVFDEYKAAKYSKRFLAQHEAVLADYRAAKAALNDLLDGAKLPKMAQLKEKHRKLAAEKKALYAKYRAAQQEMRQAVAVKTNIDYLLGVTDGRKNKEQEQ